MTSAEPFVSVVTPFYNTAEYLAECIESVLKQTHSNFEYLLIDNQSTDRSAEIAREYAKKDSRLRVIQTPSFLSQVKNYNFSLEQISGESRYTKIVQADDWIFPRCLSEMLPLAEAHPNIGVVSSYELRDTEVIGTGLHPSRAVLSGREACRLYLLDGVCMFGSPTTVLYRSDIVRARRPFYEEGRLHEDTEAAFEVLSSSDFGFVHQVLSFTRVHANSITGSLIDYTPAALDRLVLVKRYGERVLEPGEYRACLRHAERWVHGTLARQWLRERFGSPRPDFWDYQHRGLATIGYRIRPAAIALHVGSVLARNVLTSPFRLLGSQAGPRARTSS